MELVIRGNPDEIKKVLLAISGSQEHKELLQVVKQIREDHKPISREELREMMKHATEVKS